MGVKETVRDIKNGKMNREIDEKYAGGFWDFAGEVADACHLKYEAEYELLQENLYGIFYNIVEECLKKEIKEGGNGKTLGGLHGIFEAKQALTAIVKEIVKKVK